MPNRAPPTPGRFTEPNFLAIEEAVARATFPISKIELMREVDGATVLVNGSNRDLRELVKDLHDDHFDNIEEFHAALEAAFSDEFDTEVGDEAAPAQQASAWNDPDYGKQRGAADFPEYLDARPEEPERSATRRPRP